MRAHQINEVGLIVNTIEVDSLDVFPGLVDAEIGGGIGDSIIGGVLVPKTAAADVPHKVTMRQARQALFARGKLDDVTSAISSMPSPQKEAALIEWEYSSEVERNRPLVIALGQAIGLSSGDMDQLFIEAARL